MRYAMRKGITKSGNREINFWVFENNAQDIPVIYDLLNLTQQTVSSRDEDLGKPVQLRWNSTAGKLIVPSNGEDTTMIKGNYMVVYTNKKIEVMSKRYFLEHFREH